MEYQDQNNQQQYCCDRWAACRSAALVETFWDSSGFSKNCSLTVALLKWIDPEDIQPALGTVRR